MTFHIFLLLAISASALGEECQTRGDQGASYRGSVSKTMSGKTCQAWDKQFPHMHSQSTDTLTSNFCRNPDGEEGVWCYTTDPKTRWEYCGVPVKDSCDTTDPSKPACEGESCAEAEAEHSMVVMARIAFHCPKSNTTGIRSACDQDLLINMKKCKDLTCILSLITGSKNCEGTIEICNALSRLEDFTATSRFKLCQGPLGTRPEAGTCSVRDQIRDTGAILAAGMACLAWGTDNPALPQCILSIAGDFEDECICDNIGFLVPLEQLPFCKQTLQSSGGLRSVPIGDNGLIRNDWKTIEEKVQIRFFSSQDISGSPSADQLWQLGQDMKCTVSGTATVTVTPSTNYDSGKPMKLFTHGFGSSDVSDKVAAIAKGWVRQYKGEYGVILLDWSSLASNSMTWTGSTYNNAARNGIDVGNFVGKCLAGLSKEHGLGPIHLVGHSLGAHLVGKIGRSFKAATGKLVDRVTGLDPAGPRFVDGWWHYALPELKANILNPESGAYVDIIHTNGWLTAAAVDPRNGPHFGALQQLGHRDFYARGGVQQPGCEGMLTGSVCSHSRSILYFLHSITDTGLFPSQLCNSVDKCQNKEHNTDVVAYMGEPSQHDWASGEQQLFYTDVADCTWTEDLSCKAS